MIILICLFLTDGNAASGNAVSHPGICEPLTSEECKTQNSWLTECAAADEGSDDAADEGSDDGTNAAMSVTAANLITLFTFALAFAF